MSFTTWTPLEVSSKAFSWTGKVWRMVESQHIAGSMKLVDSLDEQDLLETLLESSKPERPSATKRLDYLLATPFRYHPIRGGSRFRASGDPGVFYGAESVRTAAAELGYWRWKFLRDAKDLDRIEPTAHTAFCVDIQAQVIDLQRPPFEAHSSLWRNPGDYSATQKMARTARDANIEGILYRSVRDPEPAWCMALLSPSGFAQSKPHAAMQTWYLAVSLQEVTLRRDTESLQFSAAAWRSS